jgi:glucose/arabinose dehydrogenase
MTVNAMPIAANTPEKTIPAKSPRTLRRVLLALLIIVLLVSAVLISRHKGGYFRMLAVPYGRAFDTWKVKTTRVGGAFTLPVAIANAGDGSNRLFVVEKAGVIRIIADGRTLPAPFLDIHTLIDSVSSERGLLGLAFDPNYKDNHRFFVYYTDVNGDTAVARYAVTGSDPNVADPTSGAIILRQKQPYPNHNGGQLAFSPKNGYLYIGLGDGGSGGDPMKNGQNKGTFLGKILRLDVSDSAKPYTIPADNPVSRDSAFAPEVWDYGLRNPWRFSFDAQTGDLWIGDVGQGAWEEVDFEPATSAGGNNYGWNIMEGTHPYNDATVPADANFVPPIYEYSHQEGIAVTGGFVYRGAKIPALDGVYLFGDYGFGTFWTTQRSGGTWKTDVFLANSGHQISSFGEDEQHELYFADLKGQVFRFEPM